MAGKRQPITSPAVPDFPSWWQEAQGQPVSHAAAGAGGKAAAAKVRTIDTLVRFGAVVKTDAAAASAAGPA